MYVPAVEDKIIFHKNLSNKKIQAPQLSFWDEPAGALVSSTWRM